MKKFVVLTIVTMMFMSAALACAAPATKPAATAEPSAQPTQMPIGTPETADSASALENTTGIELYIKQKTVTTATESVALIIINGSDKNYTYDYVQKLERKNANGEWETVPLTNEAVSMALLTLASGETQEQVFDFANHYEPLTRGSYRIVKTFVDEAGTASDVTCEFDAL